eukprot:68849-Rhodomonas_salina.2
MYFRFTRTPADPYTETLMARQHTDTRAFNDGVPCTERSTETCAAHCSSACLSLRLSLPPFLSCAMRP